MDSGKLILWRVLPADSDCHLLRLCLQAGACEPELEHDPGCSGIHNQSLYSQACYCGHADCRSADAIPSNVLGGRTDAVFDGGISKGHHPVDPARLGGFAEYCCPAARLVHPYPQLCHTHRNQSMCGFVGLGLYVLKLGLLFPYSLLTIGMGVLTQPGLTAMENLLFFLMNGVYLVVLSVWSIRRLRYKDVG